MPDFFTLDETRLAVVAAGLDIETDHDAVLALQAAILGDDDSAPLLAGPCEIAVDLLADDNGEIDGYRAILHPPGSPWLASDIQRVTGHLDAGLDTAGIIRDFAAVASALWAWHLAAARPAAPYYDPDEMIRVSLTWTEVVTREAWRDLTTAPIRRRGYNPRDPESVRRYLLAADDFDGIDWYPWHSEFAEDSRRIDTSDAQIVTVAIGRAS